MKKIILISICFVFIIACKHKNIPLISWEETTFHGNIKSVVEITYHPKIVDDSIVMMPLSGSFNRIDVAPNGQQTLEEVWADEYGQIEKRWYYVYSPSGILIEEQHLDAEKDPDNPVEEDYKSISKYDQYGNPTETYIYEGDSLARKIIYKNTYQRDKIQKTVSYNALTDDIRYTNTYQYNKKGLLIREEFDNGNHNDFKYDTKGRLIYKRMSSGGQYYTYKYDKNDNKIEEKLFDEDGGERLNTFYKYDANNRVIECKHTPALGQEYYRNTRWYNTNGDMIKQESAWNTPETDLSYTYTYTYDAQGNWIKRITYDEGNICKVVIRTIEYYP
ncbi:hypothetical protein [Capnocytophaga bilenii]|jgi:lipoprotein